MCGIVIVRLLYWLMRGRRTAKAADFKEEEDKKEHNTATTDYRWDQVGSTSEEDKKNEEEVVWIKYNCLCSFILSFSCRILTLMKRSAFDPSN